MFWLSMRRWFEAVEEDEEDEERSYLAHSASLVTCTTDIARSAWLNLANHRTHLREHNRFKMSQWAPIKKVGMSVETIVTSEAVY